jgi:hypothetical protein
MLFLQQRVTLFDQLIELFLLLGDPLGGSFFIPSARRPGSLFNQLPHIVLSIAMRSLSSGKESELSLLIFVPEVFMAQGTAR